MSVQIDEKQLMESEILAHRITESCNNVPSFYLVSIAQHSKNSKIPLCSQCVLIEVREVLQIKFKFCSDLIGEMLDFIFEKNYLLTGSETTCQYMNSIQKINVATLSNFYFIIKFNHWYTTDTI
ncbi:uncharacterized protein BX663DRAFT_486182 [Cokeromyces recurvatus]|uniref:uncharacterized protein n=1 Tax=Cokeromyces recurvatus TaxID=90255 RepID=UPI00221E6601|nr:uncharacterized protein BX663DRAFT_486182 [Cokeromyces recurvatus]KAI7902887.1 hypothetical protein BX663DRAFT_486182 [Cokeromyces recurvatus]